MQALQVCIHELQNHNLFISFSDLNDYLNTFWKLRDWHLNSTIDNSPCRNQASVHLVKRYLLTLFKMNLLFKNKK